MCPPRSAAGASASPHRPGAVHRAHVSTSPSDHAVDLFYVTGAWAQLRTLGAALTLHADNRNELPSSERFKDVQECVHACAARRWS